MASNYNFDQVLDKAILFAVGNTLVCDDHKEAKIVIETLSLGKLHRLCGALYSSVKLHLMLNSKRLIDGDGERDPIINTSLLEASNFLVLKLFSMVCQPAEVLGLVDIPSHIRFWGIDSGLRHSIGGADYGSVRIGAFMDGKMIKSIVSDISSQSYSNGIGNNLDELEEYGIEPLHDEASLD
nr:L-arabinokinase-like [Tanacetum cinerariifolium]